MYSQSVPGNYQCKNILLRGLFIHLSSLTLKTQVLHSPVWGFMMSRSQVPYLSHILLWSKIYIQSKIYFYDSRTAKSTINLFHHSGIFKYICVFVSLHKTDIGRWTKRILGATTWAESFVFLLKNLTTSTLILKAELGEALLIELQVLTVLLIVARETQHLNFYQAR